MSDAVSNPAGHRDRPPADVRLFADGCFGGMAFFFLSTIDSIVAGTDPYNFLLINYLPLLVGAGAIIGTLIGGIIWLAEYFLGGRQGFLVRIMIGTAATAIVYAFLINMLAERTTDHSELFHGVLLGVFLTVAIAVSSFLRSRRS